MQLLPYPLLINASPATRQIPIYWRQSFNPAGGNVLGETILPFDEVLVIGNHTLAGSVTIIPDSDAVENLRVKFKYQAELVTNTAEGKTLSIFGYNFTDAQALKRAILDCYFNGTTWEVSYFPDFTEDGIVDGRHFADGTITEPKLASNILTERLFIDNTIPGSALGDNSIQGRSFQNNTIPGAAMVEKSVGSDKIGDRQIGNDKLANMLAGTVKVGNAANEPEDVQMNDPGVGSILIAQGYGNKPLPKQVIHQGSLTKDGLFYINPGAIITQNIGTYQVTAEKCDDTMVSDPIYIMLDFADASRNQIKMGYKGLMWSAWGSVEKDIVGDGVITIKRNDNTIVGTITVLDGQVKDITAYSTDIVDGNFDKMDTFKFECSGSTAGKVLLTAFCVKRP